MREHDECLADARQRGTLDADGSAMSDLKEQSALKDALAMVEDALDGISVVDPRVHDQADRLVRAEADERYAEHQRKQLALQRPLVSALATLLLADLVRQPVSGGAR